MALLGLGGLVWAWNTPERQRGRLAGRLEIGDDTARVVEVLAERGVACPTAPLEHLRDRFPGDTPPATVEAALERLGRETARRRVIPLPGEPGGCTPAAGATEIGVDPDGRLLWIVPVTGRTPLRLPEDFVPQESDA